MAVKPQDTKHIMISYQWDCQERAIQLRDKLKAEGYCIWMDVDLMRGDILDCMADAVANAEVVLICISEKYQASKNCKAEAKYAFKKDKTIVPLKMENEFDPSGWLDILLGDTLYYNIHSVDDLNEQFPNIVKELGSKGKSVKQAQWGPVSATGGSKALQCSICLERFKTPKTLPCLHSFCKDCLIRLAPMGTKTMTCPLCRQAHPIPVGGVTQFPTNFHLKELVDEEASRQQQLTDPESEFPCTCCETGRQTKVVARCSDCKHYICATGLSAHKQIPSFRSHNVLLFEDHQDTEDNKEDMSERAKSASETKKENGWALFDEMYDEEHSINLIKYWMQKNVGNDWRSAMVSHYLDSLSKLEESGLVCEEKIARRQQQVARVFKQAGQYDNAIELAEKALELEKKELGQRPEEMADLYYLAADIYREIINSVSRTDAQDPRLVQKLIKYARGSYNLRKKMSGDDNKFQLGQILKLLSGTLVIWADCGGDSMLSAEDAMKESAKHIDEAIQIFRKLEAKGNVAKALANKANLQARGSEERKKLYKDALDLCKEIYGESCVLSGNLHRAMGVLFEDRKNYTEAYKWFAKCYDIREKVFGEYHPHTQQIFEEINCDFYKDIKQQLEDMTI